MYHTHAVQLLGAAMIESAVQDFRAIPRLTPEHRKSEATTPSFLVAQEAKRFLFEDQTLERTIDLFSLKLDAAAIRARLLQ